MCIYVCVFVCLCSFRESPPLEHYSLSQDNWMTKEGAFGDNGHQNNDEVSDKEMLKLPVHDRCVLHTTMIRVV